MKIYFFVVLNCQAYYIKVILPKRRSHFHCALRHRCWPGVSRRHCDRPLRSHFYSQGLDCPGYRSCQGRPGHSLANLALCCSRRPTLEWNLQKKHNKSLLVIQKIVCTLGSR